MRKLAFCDRRGVIEFADCLDNVPLGVMVFADGDDELMQKVRVRARHAYDGETLLVPGIPEADSEEEALVAFRQWHRWAFPDQGMFLHVDGKAGL
ncbi:host nuclease inhibitor protein [Martelella mediterranea]|uniref:Uncharacterized protein n=1 Tax=Martelella mediterranea TaxID=293089 RepID=A0A4R3NX52_9HYPH|nr:host nuclease inhibitor protein [Martelella mediterranea]TCT37449.1 hypothetical protein EDC90_101826 [Martelella mediterranea]